MPDNSPLSGASVVPSFSEDFKSTNADFIIYDVWYNDKIHVTEPEYEFIKRAFGGYVLTEPLAKLRDGFLVEDMKALANEYISGKNALYYGLRYDNPEKTQSSLGRKYEQNVSSNYSNGAIYVNVSNIAFSTALVSSTNQTVKGAEIDGYYLVSFFFVQTYRNPHAIGINRSVVFRDKAKGLAFYQKVKELLDYKIV
ncbi:MAG: hypothetical protein Q4G08_02925 [Capnocytophaga sp.]|nr:hypothetical protein [Capnocytophaga sp.]